MAIPTKIIKDKLTYLIGLVFFIFNLFFPIYCLIRANNKMESKYSELDKSEINIIYDYETHEENNLCEGLYNYLQKDLKRKDQIENKGKSILFIITLSMTFILGVINLFYNKDAKLTSISIVFLAIIVFYLVLAAVTTLKTIDTKGYSNLYLERFNLNYDEKEITNIYFTQENKKEKIKKLYKYIKLNEIIIIQKNNILFCTLDLLKLSLFFMILFFAESIMNTYLNFTLISRICYNIILLIILFFISNKIK